MSNYRRARCGSTYFFTLVTYKRQPILCLPESIKVLKDTVRKVQQARPFDINAWVLLPDHLHCVWELPEGDSNYSVRWALIKKTFTKGIQGLIETPLPSNSRLKHREATVWQRRFWEHRIRDEADMRRHSDYIHYNPVKHGLVDSPKDWEHSTFHRYVEAGIYPEDWGGGVSDIPGVGNE